MAKSRLSVSASRVLLGLGVVGMTATGLSAETVNGPIKTGEGIVSGQTAGEPTITFTENDNTLGTLGQHTKDGSTTDITTLKVVNGGNLTINGTLGKSLTGKYFNTTLAVTKVIVGAGNSIITGDSKTTAITGAIEMAGGKIQVDSNGTWTETNVSGVTVKGSGSEIIVDNDFKLAKDAGNLVMTAGSSLTVKSTSTQKTVTVGHGGAGAIQMQGGNTLTVDKAGFTSTGKATATGAENKIDIINGGKLTIANGLELNGSAQGAADLTITGTNAATDLAAITANGFRVGTTTGNATLTLKNVGASGGTNVEIFAAVLGASAGAANEFVVDKSFVLASQATAIDSKAEGDTLTIKNGGEFKASGAATFAGGKNVINVDGKNSLLEIADQKALTFSKGGNVVNVTDGGKINFAGSTNGALTLTKGNTTFNVSGENSNITIAANRTFTTSNSGGVVFNISDKGSVNNNVADMTFKGGKNEINVDGKNSIYDAGDKATKYEGLGNEINLTNGGEFKSTNGDAGAILVDSKTKKSDLTITLDKSSKFDISTGGITVGGAGAFGASLTIKGANNTADSAEAGKNFFIDAATDGITLGADSQTQNYGLNLINSDIATKITLAGNTSGTNSHTISLDNSTLKATGAAIGISKYNKSFTVDMKNESTFITNYDLAVTGTDTDGATLKVKGGKFIVSNSSDEYKTAGDKTLTLGTAAAANGLASFTDSEVIVDKLVHAVTGTKNSTLTLKNSSMTVLGTTAINGGAAVDNIFNLDNSTINLAGGFEVSKDLTSGNSKHATFNITDGANDEARIKIKGGADTDLTGAEYKVNTRGILLKDKVLVEITGDGASVDKIANKAGKFATNDSVTFYQDVNDLINGVTVDDKYLVDESTGAHKYRSSLRAQGSAGTVTTKSKLAEKYNLTYTVKADGNKVVVNTAIGNKDLDIATKVWAAATDNHKMATDILGNGGDSKLKHDVTNALSAHTAATANTISKKNEYEAATEAADKQTKYTAWQNAIKAEADAKAKYDNLFAAQNELNKIAAGTVPVDEPTAGDLSGVIQYVAPTMSAINKDVAINTVKVVDGAKNEDLTLIMLNGTNADLPAISVNNSGNTKEGLEIIASIANSKMDVNKIWGYISNAGFAKDVRDDAKSLSAMGDASTSVNAAISVANDMNISNRLASLNNPHAQIAEAKRFAALGSDASYSYYDTYKRSVWANVFGGVNIIDGENGGLIGVSAGLDSYLTDNFLLGAHLTYANSKVSDGINEQKSNSFQLGVYSLYKFAPTWELNTRASLQFAPTDMNGKTNTVKYDTDFTRTSAAFNVNLGKVFDIASGMYLKPFGGVNYYYTYTPGYDRGNVLGKTDDQSASSLSLELGAEFRIYANENAYFYVTPKLEQYVLNSVDDFVGTFAGSTASYTVEAEDEKKLYGQILIGGDYRVSEALSLNAGLGVKQILANKVNDNNETFVTGNVGLKYRF